MQVKEADRHCEGTVHHNAKCLLCPLLRFLCLAAIEVDEVDDLLVPVSRRCRLDRKISRYFKHFWHLEMCRYKESRDLEFGLLNLGVCYIFWRGLPSCTVPSSLVSIKNLHEVALYLDHKSDPLKAQLMLTL